MLATCIVVLVNVYIMYAMSWLEFTAMTVMLAINTVRSGFSFPWLESLDFVFFFPFSFAGYMNVWHVYGILPRILLLLLVWVPASPFGLSTSLDLASAFWVVYWHGLSFWYILVSSVLMLVARSLYVGPTCVYRRWCKNISYPLFWYRL